MTSRKREAQQVRGYDLGHFDIYRGEGFEQVVADQVAFLERHLVEAGSISVISGTADRLIRLGSVSGPWSMGRDAKNEGERNGIHRIGAIGSQCWPVF